ncbi:MAG TPA: glycoside hydrolase family 43 protein [Phycisphaerae bacterium]|nr:glycoside hydrolase family 43 protein [Phycisphaerae bacterium]
MLSRTLSATLLSCALTSAAIASAESATPLSSPPATPPTTAPAAPDAFHPANLWLDNHNTPINAHGGGILLYNGRFYWFGEHKIAGPAGNDAHVGVHVYSSQDLTHWRDDGIALSVAKNPDSPIHEGCILERPKVLYNDLTHKFVMWFHLETKDADHPMYSAAYAGVAVADNPAGPYTFLHAGRLNAGELPLTRTADGRTLHLPLNELPDHDTFARDFDAGQMSRDCTLFTDTDGHAYFISSSEENRYLHFCQLSDDYLTVTKDFTRFTADQQGTDNEAPALFQKHGKYFLITSGTTGWAPNAARLFSADSIWGPWTYLGNPCQGSLEDRNSTFHSQSTFILPVLGHPGQFIFMADRWNPKDAIDGRYIWLPIEWNDQTPYLKWHETWDMSLFK